MRVISRTIVAAAALAILANGANGAANLTGAASQPDTSANRPEQTALASPAPPEIANGDSIAAIVNSDPVSEYDLRQRVALYLATSGLQPTPEIIKKIRDQVRDQLITERLEIQEAKKKNISISSPEIDKELNLVVADNHISIEQLKQMLARQGVDVSALRSQIAAQILWQKVVEDEFQDRINVSDEDVDAEMKRLAEGKDKAHFLVSEIFLAVETPDQDAKVLKNIDDLHAQLDAGAPFAVIARQFSQSPSAASQGEVGWVYDGQLASELNTTLEKMSAGQVSQPIRSIGGYYILLLRERMEPSNAKIPDPVATAASQGPVDKLPLARLLLPLGPKSPPAMVEKAMNFAQQVTEHVQSCTQLEKIAVQIKGQYQNMGEFRLKELNADLQKALEKSQPGQAVPPFTDAAGVEVILRCDKAAPKLEAYHMPTRKQVEESLFDQQVTAFARRYMRDLRRQADVEIR